MKENLYVKIQGAYKRYSNKSIVLNGLNMNVQEGAIYGLLGPSGCGKTTLLNCIIGRIVLDQGVITLAANSKKNIGYMPQEIALNQEFTIDEVFYFYGRLQNMSNEEIEKRRNELINFLQIPSPKRIVGTCSGGQQRRISMAVTLLHDPELLILDEPTVGVDPLLSHSIWQHFEKLITEQNKTIIITTHYIEECKNASMIGLMRGGILLAESPPSTLMEMYHCNSLEDVFLELSKRQNDYEISDISYPKKQVVELPLKSTQLITKHRLRAQLIKNMKWTLKNLPITAFVVFLPGLLFMIFGELSNNNNSRIGGNIGIVTNESCSLDNSLIPGMKSCPSTKPFTCRFIDEFNKNTYKMIFYDDIRNALDEVKHGKIFAIFEFSSNYTTCMFERLIKQYATSFRCFNDSTINVYMDNSEYPRWFSLVNSVIENLVNYMEKVSVECGFNPRIVNLPVTIIEKFNEYHKSILDNYLPAYFETISFYTTCTFTASAVLMEKTSGSFERSQISGLTFIEIMLAHVAIQLIVMTAQNIISFSILYGMYNYPMQGSFLLAYGLIIFTELFGMFYGFFLAVIIQVETLVSYAGIGTVLTIFMLCGTLWPKQAIHWTLQPVSKIIPISLSSDAYSDISVRGSGFNFSSVPIGFSVLIGGSVLFIILSIMAVKFRIGSI